MWNSAIMAFIHHLAAFTLFACLFAELILLKEKPDLRSARKIIKIDMAYGMSAFIILLIGFHRAIYFEKGFEYYLSSHAFHAKIGLFFLTAIISLYPTFTFFSWRKELNAGLTPTVDPRVLRKLHLALYIEFTALVGIIFTAVMMSKGL